MELKTIIASIEVPKSFSVQDGVTVQDWQGISAANFCIIDQSAPIGEAAEVDKQLGHQVDDATIELIARAFWRRIHAYRNDYDSELPATCPVEFVAHLSTALLLLRDKASLRPTSTSVPILEK